MEELNLKEIQNVELEVLDKIVDICDSLKLEYQLAWGTLLGAIRHNGFIPWDDDLDIVMKRADYEKFLDYCIKHKDELYPYEIINIRNNPSYVFCLSRFCDKRYYIDYQNVKDYGLGIFVDIYPLDGVGNSIEESKKFLDRCKIYYSLARLLSYKKLEPSINGHLNTILKNCAKIFASICGRERLLKKLDCLGKNTYPSTSKYIGIPIVEYKYKFIFEKGDFDKSTLHDFEGKRYCVPQQYDKILSQVYGDYMTPPPEDERIGHHFYKVYRK